MSIHEKQKVIDSLIAERDALRAELAAAERLLWRWRFSLDSSLSANRETLEEINRALRVDWNGRRLLLEDL